MPLIRRAQSNMRVNPNIHTIAPELVLEILRDECLSTLVSIAQVSHSDSLAWDWFERKTYMQIRYRVDSILFSKITAQSG